MDNPKIPTGIVIAGVGFEPTVSNLWGLRDAELLHPALMLWEFLRHSHEPSISVDIGNDDATEKKESKKHCIAKKIHQ